MLSVKKIWMVIKMNIFVKERANEILKAAYGLDAKFREGQLESIVSVVEKKKTLVIQKTGWGKSVVYFVATKILRENGSGPTIIISPLLALMKNQIESARKIGLEVATINSDNQEDWEYIYSNINNFDALIISPERFSNDQFMSYLEDVQNVQLFVVDEAHSISDWGHDFRPDYQRIVNLLDKFPSNMAILGTTATANDRVILDIKKQLGEDLSIIRGNLIRNNIAIQINPKQTREERVAWITHILTQNEKFSQGQGIIYCLTKRDCDNIAEFLAGKGISVASYHSSLDPEESQQRLSNFDKGKIRVLVSTMKLGMGYDKSDIRFVIHFQLPQNLIAYYQQIGRAGRDGLNAYAVLLYGNEDEEIINHFIESAQVNPELLSRIIKMTEPGIKFNEILANLNVSHNKLKQALKYLVVHKFIYKDGSIYRKNIGMVFNNSEEKLKQQSINSSKWKELERLKEYLTTQNCYMSFLAKELDAPDYTKECGICANCIGQNIEVTPTTAGVLNEVTHFLKEKHGKILPRKKWANNANIIKSEQMNEGWVLSEDYYFEIGRLVHQGKYIDNNFSNELIGMTCEYISDKIQSNNIDLVVPVPSLRRPNLVPDFSRKIAEELNISFAEAVIKINCSNEQKGLSNSFQRQENIEQSISIDKTMISGKRILLVDDMVDSRWSFTVIAAFLLREGALAVYPYALVKTGSGD